LRGRNRMSGVGLFGEFIERVLRAS